MNSLLVTAEKHQHTCLM